MGPLGGYSRFVLKITGESLCQEGGFGVSNTEVIALVQPIARLVSSGKQIALVCGGGNIIRGRTLQNDGVKREVADQMGMLGTVINGLAIQSALEELGVKTSLMSALGVPDVCEAFDRRRACRYLEKGKCIVFVGGTGHPYFSTDTAAALRASEIGAEIFFKGTKVDGIYSDDPVKNPDAKKFDQITYREVLRLGLGVMDQTSISLCMQNSMPIRVFSMRTSGNIERAANGEKIGTLVVPEGE